jgi:radical SAM protein with 4Fe4S-binding SPASM domain
MSLFSIAESKSRQTLPEECRNLIRQWEQEGLFSIEDIFKEFVTFYFILTQDCNGGCPYCYQPAEFRKKLEMPSNIIDDTMDFVFKTFREDKVKFHLYGGEPFLNHSLMKYAVEKYPMCWYVVTTNGLILSENTEIRDWMIKHSQNLQLSISVEVLRRKYGKEKFLEKLKPCIDVLKINKGDIHYVIDDPTDPDIYNEVVWMFEQGAPQIRLSHPRYESKIKETWSAYVDLFKKVADYVYFSGNVGFNKTAWDVAFHGNIYRKNKGLPLKLLPPTFCGCGHLYIAINSIGEMFPCDFFINFPEFKIGDIYNGFNSTCGFFRKTRDWIEELYAHCNDCPAIPDKDIRLCPRAMCLCENYINHGNPLIPSEIHCWCNKVEYEVFDYISKKAIALNVDYYGKISKTKI